MSEDALEGERWRARRCGWRKENGLWRRLCLSVWDQRSVWDQPGSICAAGLYTEAATGGEGWSEKVGSSLDGEGGQENALLSLLQLLLDSLQRLVRDQAWLLLQHLREERRSDLGVLYLQRLELLETTLEEILLEGEEGRGEGRVGGKVQEGFWGTWRRNREPGRHSHSGVKRGRGRRKHCELLLGGYRNDTWVQHRRRWRLRSLRGCCFGCGSCGCCSDGCGGSCG